MNTCHAFLTDPVDFPTHPALTGGSKVIFHKWPLQYGANICPGRIYAFINWITPSTSGLEVCRNMRVTALTAAAHITISLMEHDNSDITRSLSAGADGFFIGQFTRYKIIDSIKISQDNLTIKPDIMQCINGIILNISENKAYFRNEPLKIYPSDFAVLKYLADRPGRVITRFQLIVALGKHSKHVSERWVDVSVSRVRRALRTAGAGEILRTVRPLGYVLDADQQQPRIFRGV